MYLFKCTDCLVNHNNTCTQHTATGSWVEMFSFSGGIWLGMGFFTDVNHHLSALVIYCKGKINIYYLSS